MSIINYPMRDEVRTTRMRELTEIVCNFDYRATNIATLEVAVCVNTLKARDFEHWLKVVGIQKLSRGIGMVTVDIVDTYNRYARNHANVSELSATTIIKYLRHTLVRSLDETCVITEQYQVQGCYNWTWWSNPIKVDYNNE